MQIATLTTVKNVYLIQHILGYEHLDYLGSGRIAEHFKAKICFWVNNKHRYC